MEDNIILNSIFDEGLLNWDANSCTVVLSDGFGGTKMETGAHCALVTDRKEAWQGLEQDITARLKVNVKYSVTAVVGIMSSFQTTSDVLATLRIENSRSPTRYLFLGKVQASTNEWVKLQGSFCLDSAPEKVVFYLEGPPPGIDLLIKFVEMRPCVESQSRQHPVVKKDVENSPSAKQGPLVLLNPEFEDGLLHWSDKCCEISLHGAIGKAEILPLTGRHFVSVTNRTQGWHGIEQEVTGRLRERMKYDVFAVVRISGNASLAEVLATLWIKTVDGEEQYITLGKVMASTTYWMQLKGKLLLNSIPKRAIAYLEGPPSGVDLLVNSFSIFPVQKPHPTPPLIENPRFGVNILENSDLLNCLTGWYALGSCSLVSCSGAPCIIPPAAKNTLGHELSVSGYYIKATNRKYVWEGPAQTLTGKLQLFLPYQVSAWVRIGNGGDGPQKVNVALGVDGKWMNGGEIEGDQESWREIAGSFRLEKQPDQVIIYVQGPSSGVDLMVAGLRIFAVDRKSRFAMLKAETDMVRKRNVILHLKSKDGCSFSCQAVNVNQIHNNFPLGSCINQYSLENELYVQFFLKHFNWAVFENEIKWSWTEQQQGQINYHEADILNNFCIQHDIPARGHCIIWETENAVQDWLKKLTQHELAAAVQSRIVDLVSRYVGKFKHYDVNNEMLHGSFFKDRLGAEIWPYMFKLAHQFDPSTKLFVNDYHVVDGYDANSSPEKYIDQIKVLQNQGAPVGGIGVQGHVDTPIGAIIFSALEKLSMVRLPIWFTEVDVASLNEFVRGEDLEVILREAYAHPAVEGIMLWGFWETAMHREQGHLVDADGTINEAGKRLIALRKEWHTSIEGHTDDLGQFKFNGYHGSYILSANTKEGQIQKEFKIEIGDGPLVLEVLV